MSRLIIICSEFPPQPGGIGHQALNLANILHQAGKKPEILTNSREKKGASEPSFDQTLPYPVHRIRPHTFLFRSYWLRFVRLFQLLQRLPEASLIASGQFSLWMGAIAKIRHPNTFTLAVLHGSEFSGNALRKWLTIRSLRKFNALVAVSHFTRNTVLLHHPNANIQVILNGVDVDKFKPINSVPPPRHHQPALLTLGNISRRKGQHQVIGALPTLLNRYPKVHYCMIGLPTQQAYIEKLVAQKGLQSHISILGTLPDTKVASILQQTDVFIMLSENTPDGDKEGFGMAIVEANAQGIPAIGARGCGIEDAICNGISGRLVDGTNATEILGPLSDIVENYAHFSEGARRWSEQFSWKDKGAEYLTLLP